MYENPLFAAFSAGPEQISYDHRLRGWGGRDRTSEWRNQNPLPYRLATPQLAVFGTTEGQLTADSRRLRPSIERGPAFQQVRG
jgi:hypothetical protein